MGREKETETSTEVLFGNTANQGEPRNCRPSEEQLPFTVRIVTSDEELEKAVHIRHSAYARHMPLVAELFRAPEECDREQGSAVLLAESKLDGSALGTMRIQTNSCKNLALEQSIPLPSWLVGKRLAEATRLGVSEGRVGRLVKILLFKAYYQYCLTAGVQWMVITARSPLDRQYEALLFKDVFPDVGYVSMKHVGNIPHRVLALSVASVEPSWGKVNHPLYNFFFRTHHPDLHLSLVPAFTPRPQESVASYLEAELA